MPALTAIAFAASSPLRHAAGMLALGFARVLKQVAGLLKNRREAKQLAGLDDRMLADIGLTRSDLRDAYAEPLWHDPTEVLARRACERRGHRQRSKAQPKVQPKASSKTPPVQRIFATPPVGCYPPVDRPARYLM